MKPHVNAIAGRLSLRPPQRRSLELLDRVTEIVPPAKGADLLAALEVIRSEFPTVQDFEREFPSICFALATGVGIMPRGGLCRVDDPAPCLCWAHAPSHAA